MNTTPHPQHHDNLTDAQREAIKEAGGIAGGYERFGKEPADIDRHGAETDEMGIAVGYEKFETAQQ